MSAAISSSADARLEVCALDELPPLHQNMDRLVTACTSDDLNLEDLARMVEEVPSLAARIVGVASSAYFGNARAVRSVSDAVIRVLGLRLVRSLVVGIIVSDAFDWGRCRRFSAEQYWGSAVLTAVFARLLAPACQGPDAPRADPAYLCGLLHNLGLLALVHVAPGPMDRIFSNVSAHPGRPLAQAERDSLGFDHSNAGAWLCERWHLPEEVGFTIEHHHRSEYRGPHWRMALLVGLCARWARQKLAGVDSPWLEHRSREALGIRSRDLEAVVDQCERDLQDVADLAKLLAR